MPKTSLPTPIPNFFLDLTTLSRALADILSPHISKSNKSRASPDPRPSLDSQPEETIAAVLPSSTELFYFYRKSLDQCVKLGVGVGTGKAMFDLANVWQKWLRVYAGTKPSILWPRGVMLTSFAMSRGYPFNQTKTASQNNLIAMAWAMAD